MVRSALCSLLSAIAPMTSSPLYSWSANHGLPWLVFALCGVCTGLLLFISHGIPRGLG